MKKIGVVLTFCTAFLEVYTLSIWLRCTNFQSLLHVEFSDVSLQVTDLIHTDQHQSLLLIRLFHNKIIVAILDTITAITHFFDPLFVTTFISFLGMLCFFYGCFVLLQKTNKYLALFIPLIIGILLEIFYHHQFFLLRFGLLGVSFLAISLLGNWTFLGAGKSKKRIIVWLVLLTISILWLLFLPSDLYRYCIQP